MTNVIEQLKAAIIAVKNDEGLELAKSSGEYTYSCVNLEVFFKEDHSQSSVEVAALFDTIVEEIEDLYNSNKLSEGELKEIARIVREVC